MARDADCLHETSLVPPSVECALGTLPPVFRAWFTSHYAHPTPAQRLAWDAVTAGKNLLLCAPTGSGKSLAAFLPILGQLCTEPATGRIRCIYVAPLKALIADVRRNLKKILRPLALGGARRIRVGWRTGDASPRVRRVLNLRPPDILLTTPESLAVMLSQPDASDWFGQLRWLVVDEVHAFAADKRGADLALSAERLEVIAGTPLQRVGLSATCAPVAAAARFLTGVDRPCTIAQVAESAPLDLVIEPLEQTDLGFVPSLLARLKPELQNNRTTLIFANSRSLAERLTWALKRRYPGWVEQIGVHHSSLSAPRRRRVERLLKEGRLRIAVSSTSLELGIDIGSVDGVVLIHPPGGVVRLLQRVGRAGHGPDRPRRGLVLTSTPGELLEAAVTGASSHSRQYESLRESDAPFDVLCQQLLGMAAQRPHTAEEAFALVRRANPYRHLSRDDFDDCLRYLSGQTRDGENWLPSRLFWLDDSFVIADERTARLLRRNIGTILSNEPCTVCIVRSENGEASGAKSEERDIVGELDQPYADRLKPGDRFLLDGRCLEFRHLKGQSLIVEETAGQPSVPRWEGGTWPLSPEYAWRHYLLRTRAGEALRENPVALARMLQDEYGLGDRATTALVDLLEQQESVSEIPGAGMCLIETVQMHMRINYYIHTPLNRAANDALARVAVSRLARDHGRSAASLVADLGIWLSVAGEQVLDGEAWRDVFAPTDFEADLTSEIANSATLRQRFHAVAQTGLMILRNPLGWRRPTRPNRWAKDRLFERTCAVDPDFVLLRQAWREVHAEVLETTVAQQFAERLQHLTIRQRWLTEMSPLAASWTHTGSGPTESADSTADTLARLHTQLTSSMQ